LSTTKRVADIGTLHVGQRKTIVALTQSAHEMHLDINQDDLLEVSLGK
jgi:hypothetical protein